MTPPEYETRIQAITAQLKKLTPPTKIGKGTAAYKTELKDYEEAKAKLEAQRTLFKKYATIYTQIHVGDGVAADGKTGVIVEKVINVGGLPQVWVYWGVSTIPYPEYPAISGEWRLQFFPACGLDESVEIQKEDVA